MRTQRTIERAILVGGALVLGLLAAGAGGAAGLCADYCRQVMGEAHGVCVGEYQIYDTVGACLATCAGFPTDGAEGAVSGNSVQCRTEHAILAQGVEGPEKHCPHAAPEGGGVCIDRSPCSAYCLFYYDRVTEGDCPAVAEWGDFPGKDEQGSGHFTPNPRCMETCATFAESGAEWEMSGDSANCRMQFYLMAHRRAEDSENHSAAQLASLCQNAHPYDTEMCQGYTFGDYYKVRETDPCRELCYNDRLTCGGAWGKPVECMEACAAIPEIGERQATQGDSVYCRLTWAQYAFFVAPDDPTRQVLCAFAKPESLVCRDPGATGVGKGAALPPALREAIGGH